MKPSWMSDARQIPDEVMTFLRQIAVCAVKEKNVHVDDVSKTLSRRAKLGVSCGV